MKPQHAIAILLVAALAAVDAAALLALRLSGHDWPHLDSIVSLGLAFGQTNLAAAYFVFGRANIALRGAALMLATGGLGCLADYATGSAPLHLAVWWTIMLACAAPLVAVALAVRWLGLRIMHESDPHDERPLQFSIGWLLSLTTAAALLFGIGRYLELPPEELPAVILFCLGINLVPLLCMSCVFGLGHWWLRVGLPAVICPQFGVLLAFTGFPPPKDYIPLGIMTGIQGICILASCAALRVAGYRLAGKTERWREGEKERQRD